MASKIKSGFILFFFLTSIILIISKPIPFYYLDYYQEGTTQNLEWIFYSIFLALLLSINFSFLLFKSEQKIKENNYSYGWLILHNLIFSFIFYILFCYLGLIAINPSPAGESGMAVILIISNGLWVTPVIVLVFSIVPQLFFYKFYSNKYFLKIASLFFIMLSVIIFFVFFIVPNASCKFGGDLNKLYSKDECLSANTIIKAVKSNNLEECEKEKSKEEEGKCYEMVRLNTGMDKNISFCDNFSDEQIYKSWCITDVAAKLNNPKLCEKIKNKEKEGFNRESCYNSVMSRNESLTTK